MFTRVVDITTKPGKSHEVANTINESAPRSRRCCRISSKLLRLCAPSTSTLRHLTKSRLAKPPRLHPESKRWAKTAHLLLLRLHALFADCSASPHGNRLGRCWQKTRISGVRPRTSHSACLGLLDERNVRCNPALILLKPVAEPSSK